MTKASQFKKLKRRIVFMGSPEFAIPTLKEIALTHNVCAVYTQPPKQFGRGLKEKHVPVAQHAIQTGLPLFTPKNFNSKSVLSKLKSHKAEIFVVVAYGLILPTKVLTLCRFGCLNGHASILPRWRGAAPIQRALEAGDNETGVSAMIMGQGVDSGPLVHCCKTPIQKNENFESLHNRLSVLTAKCLSKVINNLPESLSNPRAQQETGICYANKITKEDTEINWSQSAAEIDRKIRAFAPRPGAWCHGPRDRLQILAAEPCILPRGTTQLPEGSFLGKSNDGAIIIRCSDQGLAINKVLPAGKKPMTAEEFLNGVVISVGDLLSNRIKGRV